MSKIASKEDLKVGEIAPKESYEVIATNAGPQIDFSVTFRVTEACDLKCNYCHWHSGRHYQHSDILVTIDRLFELFDKQGYKTVVFYYHGGEATRYSRILEVLQYVKLKGADTGITAYNEMQTNLTLSTDLLASILPYCDQLNISLHYLELTARHYKLEAFNKNFRYLVDNNVEIHNFDIMLENVPDNQITEFHTQILEYLKYPKIVNSEMIYGFCHYAYNQETATQHIAFYKQHNKTEQQYKIDGKIYNTNDLFEKGVNCVGWKCGAGIQSITVNGDGNVFHCGIHMTNYLRDCIPETPYTNLLTDPLAITKLSILRRTGTKCRWDYCGGDFYLHRTKP